MLVGRKEEIKKLNELYDNDAAEFVAVYGRRRVGKTFLIDETFRDRITFRHAGLSPVGSENDEEINASGRMKAQLDHFYNSLLKYGMEESKAPKDWLEAFFMLEVFLQKREDTSQRMLIFLDEIQWMDTPKSGFITGLEAFWNSWACFRHNVKLIVCGSSSSWILDKLINNHGGLYGRVTYQINLQPFNLCECEELFKEKGIEFSRYDMTQAYMTVGGVPYYLNYFTRGLSLAQNIQAIFFNAGAPLANELELMFSSLFVNSDVMLSIIKALVTKNRGLTRTELLKITGIPESGEVSKYLNALINGSFVIKYCSFGNGKRESFYKLIDPFCLFYLKFVEGNKGSKTVDFISIADTQSVISWKGIAFENVCFNHIKQIKAALGISGVSTSESLWSKRGGEDSDGTQIDLIIDRKDNIINMCEMKFYSDEFTVTKDTHLLMERRKKLLYEIIPKKATVHSTLITTFGLRKTEYFGDFVNTITLDELFT